MIRAHISRRRHPWAAQTRCLCRDHGPSTNGYTSVSSTGYTLSDFSTRYFYKWSVTFPQSLRQLNRDCFSHAEAVAYADRTIRDLTRELVAA